MLELACFGNRAAVWSGRRRRSGRRSRLQLATVGWVVSRCLDGSRPVRMATHPALPLSYSPPTAIKGPAAAENTRIPGYRTLRPHPTP